MEIPITIAQATLVIAAVFVAGLITGMRLRNKS